METGSGNAGEFPIKWKQHQTVAVNLLAAPDQLQIRCRRYGDRPKVRWWCASLVKSTTETRVRNLDPVGNELQQVAAKRTPVKLSKIQIPMTSFGCQIVNVVKRAVETIGSQLGNHG